MSNPSPHKRIGRCRYRMRFGYDWLGCDECGACDYFDECGDEFASISLSEENEIQLEKPEEKK